MKHFIAPAAMAAALVLTAGCASVAVSYDALERNTAQALGLARGTFTIGDRVDEGLKTSYTVKTQSGKQYTCYVTGTFSIVGRVVSDAICTEVGKAGKPASPPAPQTGPTSGQCNALLKAAGRC